MTTNNSSYPTIIDSSLMKYWKKVMEEQDKAVVFQLIKQVLDMNVLPEIHAKLGEDNLYYPTVILKTMEDYVTPSSYDDELEQKQRFYELLEITRASLLKYYNSSPTTKTEVDEK